MDGMISRCGIERLPPLTAAMAVAMADMHSDMLRSVATRAASMSWTNLAAG